MINILSTITPAEYVTNYLEFAPCISVPGLEDFIHPCFIPYLNEICTEIILEDKSEYNDIDLSLVTIQGNLYYQYHECGIRYAVCSGFSIEPTTKNTYNATYGNGLYSFEITVNYIDGLTTYTKTYCYSIKVLCCEDDICSLKETIKDKISDIGCKINDLEIIGKNTNELYKSLYLLENALFLLSTSKDQEVCNDVDIVNCFLNSIKNIC